MNWKQNNGPKRALNDIVDAFETDDDASQQKMVDGITQLYVFEAKKSGVNVKEVADMLDEEEENGVDGLLESDVFEYLTTPASYKKSSTESVEKLSEHISNLKLDLDTLNGKVVITM